MTSFFVGAIGFLATQAWWGLKHRTPSGQHQWVLEPSNGILFCAVGVLIVVAAAVASRSREMRWLKGAALAISGVGVGLVIGLFAVGPGNLWPIVIALNFGFLAPSVILGSALGELLFALRLRAL